MAKHDQLAEKPSTNCNNLYLVHDFVDIDAARVGELAIVTVSASIQQHPVVLNARNGHVTVLFMCTVTKQLVYFVLLGVEHVVALLAKADANKSWTFSRRFCHPLFQCLCKQTIDKSSFEVGD